MRVLGVADSLLSLLGLVTLVGCTTEQVTVPQASGAHGLPARWAKAEWNFVVARPNPGPLPTWHRVPELLEQASHEWGLEIAIVEAAVTQPQSEDGVNTLAVLPERKFIDGGGSKEAEARTLLYTRAAPSGDFAEIVEADILIRLEALAWDSEGLELQLKALLVHELGHFIGLDHVCAQSLEKASSFPECSALPSMGHSFAMHPKALRETNQLALAPHQLELRKVRELYPP